MGEQRDDHEGQRAPEREPIRPMTHETVPMCVEHAIDEITRRDTELAALKQQLATAHTELVELRCLKRKAADDSSREWRSQLAHVEERNALKQQLETAQAGERSKVVNLLKDARQALLDADCLETAYQDGYDSEMFATAVILVEAMK